MNPPSTGLWPLQWSRLSLQTKVSCVLLVIVGVSAASAEFFDRQYVGRVAQENLREEMAAVARQIGGGIHSLSDLHNQAAWEVELYKLLASRPDLIDVGVYGGPAPEEEIPSLLASAGNTALPRLERVPPLVEQVLGQGQTVTDLDGWATEHRLKIAAPIFVDGQVAGASYAEFSTAQFDEVLEYQRALSLKRRIVEATVIVLAINLFFYLKIHRPLRTLLSAVDAVARGSRSAMVPVRQQDEVGQLGSRFNAMVSKIREAIEENKRLYEELQRAHDGLQVRVEEATEEILQKNRELERTNELLSTAQREAARAHRLSVIGQLAATVGHKIGTPLTALSGHIQLLGEDPNLSAEARRRLRSVETQIERTSRIVQDLLIYARKPDLVLAPLDLNTCLDECLALLRPELTRQHVEVVAMLGPDLPKVQADQIQLLEVFCNLIENAMDAMQEGGTLTVKTSRANASRSDPHHGHLRHLAVDISDTGPGIAPEHLDQIFQPFFSTKKAGRGTGLGLAIVHDTVRAHGGQVTVESEVGKGTRFVVVLPEAGGAD